MQPDNESLWVETYRPLIELTFDLWAQRGEWPSIAELQRVMDREDHDVEVLLAFEAMPRVAGEQRAVQLTAVPLPIRVLRHLPQARPLLDASVELVKRALEIYRSDSPDLRVSYDDPRFSRIPAEILRRATVIMTSDYPFPFGGGNYGPTVDQWSIEINPMNARYFRGVTSIDDYVAAQSRVLARTRPQTVAEVARKYEVFVIMPFGEAWSAGVYDLIKRAAFSLKEALDVSVYRADEISRPGKITDQIMGAIEQADAIIADITGENSNVMWELGYAQGLRRRAVILNQRIHEAPFDLRDWRQVLYSSTPTEADMQTIAEHIAQALFDAPT